MNPTINPPLDSQRPDSDIEDDRTGLSVETLKRALIDNLFYVQGKFREIATKNDFLHGLGVYRARSIVAALDKHH
jgi:glycogen phosphorylase